MPKKGQFIDIAGAKYGNWTVIKKDETSARRTLWICECSCGNHRSVFLGHLRGGASKSCGCQKPKGEGHVRYKHGMSESPEFKTWLQMHTRCYNPNISEWARYGGRCIKSCDRWKDDFSLFLADMGPRPSPAHSIDRKDVDLDYDPDNCRWATKKEQARNTSRTLWVELDGDKVSLAEACEKSGIPYSSAQERVAAGKHWRGATHGV